jgi:hypothetical protein
MVVESHCAIGCSWRDNTATNHTKVFLSQDQHSMMRIGWLLLMLLSLMSLLSLLLFQKIIFMRPKFGCMSSL